MNIIENIKCAECEFKSFVKGNGSPNRYYCINPITMQGVGARMICRCERGSEKLTIKTAPKWCPLRGKK